MTVAAISTTPLVRGPVTGADCARCPLAKNGQPQHPVAGEGPPDPAWVIVGEGPGGEELRTGRVFQGPSGRLVNKMLKAVGAARETLHVTNATLCAPGPATTDAQKTTAAACCKPRLEIELAQPALAGKPVLALGSVAMHVLLDTSLSITKIAGSYNLSQMGCSPGTSRAVIPSIHPAAILRGGAAGASSAHAPDLMFWNLIYDAQKVAGLAQGRDLVFRNDLLVFYPQAPELDPDLALAAEPVIEALVKAARKLKCLAVDLETYPDDKAHVALEAPHAIIRCFGLATLHAAVSIDRTLLTERALRLLRAVLADTSVTKIFHNQLYDRPVLAWNKFALGGPSIDTMLLHHNAFPGLAHDLQRVATQFFCVEPWKAEFRDGDETLAEMARYNALDTLATARLAAPLQICVTKAQAERTWEIDQKMALVAARMHHVGVPVDQRVNRELGTHFAAMVMTARAGIEAKADEPAIRDALLDRLALEQAKRIRKADPEDFLARHRIRLAELAKDFVWSINSGEHVAAYLKARGVPMHKVTEKGRTSTDKDVLEHLAYLPEVRGLLTYRENDKLLSTFVLSLRKYVDKNWRLHPMWAVNAITGRWKAALPSCQNWSKGDQIWPCAVCFAHKEQCACEGGYQKLPASFDNWLAIPHERKMVPNLRWQVRARRGMKLLAFDFAQLEARIIALYSGEPFLLDIFNRGKDIHDEFSKIVWPGWETMNVDIRKELRDLTKRVEFAGFYGAAVDTAYENIRRDKPNVKRQDIARALDLINRQLTRVNAWHQQVIREVATTGETRSAILGRRFVFPLGNADPTVLANAPVQSAAADIMNMGTARFVDSKPQRAEPILQIHDSLVVECPEADVEVTQRAMQDCFAQEHTLNGVTVQFPITLHVGDSWGEV